MTKDSFIKQLRTAFPDLDSDVLEYAESYVQETSMDELLQPEQLFEFLVPLINADESESTEQQLKSLCDAFTAKIKLEKSSKNLDKSSADNLDNGAKPLTLRNPVQMDQLHINAATSDLTIPKMATDISLASKSGRLFTNSFTSQVDKKKLEKAEQRLLRKQEEREAQDEAKEQREVQEFIDLSKDTTDYHSMNTLIDPTLGKGKTKDIKIENFDISFGGKRILLNASLNLVYGRRYGLIGRNGVGKSTLLRAISRRDIAVSGKEVGVPEWLRILHVEQEINGDETPVIQSVLDADAHRTTLMKQEKDFTAELAKLETDKSPDAVKRRDELSNALKDVYSKLQFIEAEKAEARASVILSGLGFNSEQQRQPTKTFSGGWRMRISLARALFCKPDVLLCDEPTNHLDINAVVWLERYLCSWPNTLLVVSHDRDFLDEVVTDVIHMHNERLDTYRGNYSTFLGTRLERRKNQLKEYEAQLQYRQHLQSFIDRWRFNAKRAAQAQSKIKILEKLPELIPPEDDGIEDGELKFRWPNPNEKLSPPILQANEVSFNYKIFDDNGKVIGEKPVLNDVSFSVGLDSRVAIVGPNGAGKSTLLKLLIGQLEPTKGIVQRHGRLRLAFFSQHHVDALEMDTNVLRGSAVDFLTSRFPGREEEEYRNILGRFGLSGTTAVQSIQTLSGGQKSRVVFALMALMNPHILVLDEVTNHLDIMTIDSLIRALNPAVGFQGGVVVVSHDARFIDHVCNELWVCRNGKIEKYCPESAVIRSADDQDIIGTSGISDYKKKILKDLNEC